MRSIQKQITIENQCINYVVRKSARARSLRLTVYPGGGLVATLPTIMAESALVHFMKEKAQWLLSKVAYLKQFSSIPHRAPRRRFGLYRKHKESALALAKNRLNYFNQFYGFSIKNIRIKNQKSRWGSCSEKGNLNFNYKIVFMSSHLADYIIVHELCHLGAFNHSCHFWNLVAKTIPDYANRRQEIRQWAQSGI